MNERKKKFIRTHTRTTRRNIYPKPYSAETFLESARLQSERDEMNERKKMWTKNIASSIE